MLSYNVIFANIGLHFLNGSSFTYNHDDNLVVQTDADYFAGTFELEACIGKQHIADLASNEFYVEQDLKTGGTNIILYSSYLESLEPNQYRINVIHRDGSASFSTYFDILIEPNLDDYDLYISLIDHEYCAYKGDEPFGVESATFNVSYNSSNNEYTINLNSDLDVYSYDSGAIFTNNEKSLIINGNNHEINVVRTLYEHHPNLIYSSANLTINNTTFEYDEALAADNEGYRRQVSWPDDGNIESSFIRCNNGNLNVNNSTINCKSYHRCVSATCDGDQVDYLYYDSYIKNSTINHTLYPAYYGLLPTVFSSNDITISNSNVVTKAVNYNEEIKSAACGVYNYYGVLNITDGSLIDVTGNPHDYIYVVQQCSIGNPAVYGWYVYIEDNSTIKIKDSQMGIYSAMDFSLSNSNIDIDCVFGGIFAYSGNIYITMGNIVPSVFSIITHGVKEYAGYYIRALQHLNRNPDRSHYYITSNMRTKFIFGSTDGFDSYDINDENNDIQIYSRIYLSDTPKKPTKNNATLVINTGADPILYMYGFGFDNDYENLDITFDNDTDTYIVNVKDDFNATSFNDDCIYTRKDLNLKIYGEGDLNIDLDCDNSVEYDLTGIGTGGSLSLGDGTNKFNVFINDNVDRDSIDFEYAPVVNAIQCQGNMCIDNTNIKAYIFGNMINYRQNNKLDSLESIGMYIKNNSIITHELIDINDTDYIFCTIYSRGLLFIDNSVINSSIKIKSNDSTQSMENFKFYDATEITNSEIHISGNNNSPTDNLAITIGNPRTDYECKFINSTIDIKNCINGIVSSNSPLTIKNCNVDISTFDSCIRTKNPFNLIVDDVRYIDKFVLQKDLSNPVFSDIKTGPIIYTSTIDNENIESLINASFPNNCKLKFLSSDNYYSNYNVYNLLDYSKVIIRNDNDEKYFEDLVICSNGKNHTAYNKTGIINGLPINNVDVSYQNGVYTINILDDVELTSNDENIITVNKEDLKIIGDGKLTLNLNCYNNKISGCCYAIDCANNLQIGDINSDGTFNIDINDNFSINNDDHLLLNSYTYGFNAVNNINIYNTKIIGNITCDLLYSDEGNIAMNNTQLIHNIYANYLYPGFYKNESGIELFTLQAKDLIKLDNNSSVKVGMVDYIEDSYIYYYCIECGRFISNDSSIDLTNYSDLSKDEFDGTFSSAVSSDIFEANNSNISIKNFYLGISGEDISLTNSNVNMKNYCSCLASFDKISIKYDNSDLEFDIESTNKGDIDVSNDVFPVIAFAKEEALIIPTSDNFIYLIPNGYIFKTDVDDIYNISNNNLYRHITLVEGEPDIPTDFKYFEMKEPKENEDGHMPYYYDEENDIYYEDSNGEIPIDNIESWLKDIDHGCIKSLNTQNHIITITPNYIINKPISSNKYIFNSNAQYNRFVLIYIDGKLVSKNNYIPSEFATDGSTNIQFTDKYINSLSIAEHTICIVSKDGCGYNTFTIKKNSNPNIPSNNTNYIIPKTGI